ncbi:hypothetical protein ACMWQU_25305, partial [Escherichia coli]|uniref:hypothetical protein n=1 Tax=Escherichia coli TaxID=562 RepID=UPI0039DFDE1D
EEVCCKRAEPLSPKFIFCKVESAVLAKLKFALMGKQLLSVCTENFIVGLDLTVIFLLIEIVSQAVKAFRVII